MSGPWLRWTLPPPLVFAVLAGCHSFHPAPIVSRNNGDRILITEEMIARSGGQNAWEVLKREAPELNYQEKHDGEPTQLGRRGRSSLVLKDTPMLFVDGVQVVDFRNLQQIPASTLFSIEILNGLDGTTYYGTNASSGVILVHTKSGTDH